VFAALTAYSLALGGLASSAHPLAQPLRPPSVASAAPQRERIGALRCACARGRRSAQRLTSARLRMRLPDDDRSPRGAPAPSILATRAPRRRASC
jgi:hypothetical protein